MTDAREHAAAELALAAVAILLTAAVVIGSMFQRPGSRAPGSAVGPPAAVSTTGPAPSSTAGGGPAPPGNLVADPGFEASVAGWLAIGGAKVGRAPVARAGRWAGGFTPTGPGDQGMALTQVLRCTPGSTYAAAVWVRASRPGTVVQVTLLEVADGRRLAADTIGAVLRLGRWQRVEVTHQAHRPGAALAFEVVLPQGSPRATVLVDDLALVAHRS